MHGLLVFCTERLYVQQMFWYDIFGERDLQEWIVFLFVVVEPESFLLLMMSYSCRKKNTRTCIFYFNKIVLKKNSYKISHAHVHAQSFRRFFLTS